MSEKTEALRLADALEMSSILRVRLQAAAELRRLSAVEAELLALRRVFSAAGCTFDVAYIRRLVRAEAQRDALLEALRGLLSYANVLEMRLLDADGEHRAMRIARAAIKAVEEQK